MTGADPAIEAALRACFIAAPTLIADLLGLVEEALPESAHVPDLDVLLPQARHHPSDEAGR